jgi:dTDP-4-amino-4,6-dideoxygalactose transaminase
VVVHFGGASASMREISELVKPYNIAIVEDAAHALGGSYQGRKVGSCQYSDMTVFSFHPVKSITTAEGGAVVTCDEKLAQKLRLFANHGVTRDVSLMESSLAEGQGSWYYQQIELGYNYRLSDLHAVLGISQMTKLDGFIERRTQLAAEYDQALDSLPLLLPDQKIGKHSAWHLYAVQLLEHDRLAIYNALHRSGIAANVHYIPIHLQPYYQQLGFKKGDYPVAESCYHRLLTLPLYPDFSTEQQHRVIDTLHTLLT